MNITASLNNKQTIHYIGEYVTELPNKPWLLIPAVMLLMFSQRPANVRLLDREKSEEKNTRFVAKYKKETQ